MVSPLCTGTVVVLPSGCFRKTWLPRLRSATKPGFFERADDLSAPGSRKAGHTVTCWMPTSSSELA